MKKILIIAPHFPPSNLAAVHRSRLFAQHLPAFNWEPVVLAVHEKFYEEQPDWNLVKLLPEDLRIEKVNAFRVTRPRLIGDIGLRAFFQLYSKARKIIKNEGIDFLYIPIPSYYIALLGRFLHAATGVKYGIDYIDPWVHHFAGSESFFSRHWFSTKLAKLLEPIAVKKASLVTGVAEGYYKGVQDRNPALLKHCVFGAMPYGGEVKDHIKIKEMSIRAYLFSRKPDKIQLVYAGAMLPKAYTVLEAILQSVADAPEVFEKTEFHFIGTGKTPDDPEGYTIRPYAEKYGLWKKIVFEYPARIPYLDVLVHLEAAAGIFVMGSTEPHYTPSKVYQGVLSGKPVLAVLHKASTAVSVIEKSKAGIALDFGGEEEVSRIRERFKIYFLKFCHFSKEFDSRSINQEIFIEYSARTVTMKLTELLDQAMQN